MSPKGVFIISSFMVFLEKFVGKLTNGEFDIDFSMSSYGREINFSGPLAAYLL